MPPLRFDGTRSEARKPPKALGRACGVRALRRLARTRRVSQRMRKVGLFSTTSIERVRGHLVHEAHDAESERVEAVQARVLGAHVRGHPQLHEGGNRVGVHA
eukprot:6196324-Pleurochrysis_carterae.AAC.2